MDTTLAFSVIQATPFDPTPRGISTVRTNPSVPDAPSVDSTTAATPTLAGAPDADGFRAIPPTTCAPEVFKIRRRRAVRSAWLIDAGMERNVVGDVVLPRVSRWS